MLKLWQGLGYYSRARNLHRAARLIAEQYGGRFPERYDEVRALPGVGEYTAAAICSFASDAPLAVLDGNVFRVLARLFDLDLPIDTTQGRRRFAELAASLLPPGRAALHNQAIMDFGALQCTPQQPRCGECPLAEHCLALAAGTVAVRPVKQGRTKVRDRWFAYVVVLCGDELLLHRRDGRDIWRGLYEFPLVERDRPLDAAELPAQEEFAQLTGGAPACGSPRWRCLPTASRTSCSTPRSTGCAWSTSPSGCPTGWCACVRSGSTTTPCRASSSAT